MNPDKEEQIYLCRYKVKLEKSMAVNGFVGTSSWCLRSSGGRIWTDGCYLCQQESDGSDVFLVLKLLKMATGMRALLDTVVQALPQVSLFTGCFSVFCQMILHIPQMMLCWCGFSCIFQVGNLGLLFMLLFFIYAALGVELLGKLGQ